MQTAIQELKYLFDDILKDRGVFIAWDTYLAQEKQQIIDAYNQWVVIKDKAEQYYNETYGSKGSDGNFKQFSLYEHKETIATADTPTFSQTEISDEEIYYQKQVMNPYPTAHQSYTVYEKGFMECAKWYREQLKKK